LYIDLLLILISVIYLLSVKYPEFAKVEYASASCFKVVPLVKPPSANAK
jgi:hypothetical protein